MDLELEIEMHLYWHRVDIWFVEKFGKTSKGRTHFLLGRLKKKKKCIAKIPVQQPEGTNQGKPQENLAFSQQ